MTRRVSVIIPAHNEASMIGDVVTAVLQQGSESIGIEVIVVDDGSADDTAAIASTAGARVEQLGTSQGGNPAAARNAGARSATGDPLVFLDADCLVQEDWLDHLLRAHAGGATMVGGSLALPKGLGIMARCDYYCGWYLINPRAPAGDVPHHPPPNLSVRREAFLSSSGFSEHPPLNYTNEERLWQSELIAEGHRIYFEPGAIAEHVNRPGFVNLLTRNYRWGYTAIEAKSTTGAARLAWLYRYPLLLIVLSPALVLAHTMFIIACWVRVGVFEPVLMLPLVFASRVAYVAGMVVGAARWLARDRGRKSTQRQGPKWR